MSEDITVYEGIKAKLKEKIKESFIDLIPENEWDKMIEAEFKAFTEGDKCEMLTMVRAEIKTTIAEEIKKEMLKPHWQTQWGGFGHQGASEAVTKIVREHSQDIMTGLVGNIVQEAVQAMQQRLQQGY